MNVDASFDVNMLRQIYCWEVIIFYTPSQSLFGKKKERKEKRTQAMKIGLWKFIVYTI